MFEYLTIASAQQIEYKEKASKFIAYAYPVFDESAIKEALETLRGLHPKATHICYAYRLGVDKTNYRANDDGEPGGSAGKPILGQIDSKELTFVLVAVVRYFGGTKLGIPGLIESYKESAKEVLSLCTIVTEKLKVLYSLGFSMEFYNDVMHHLKKNKVAVMQQNFTEQCLLVIEVEKQRENAVIESLEALYHVNLLIEKTS